MVDRFTAELAINNKHEGINCFIKNAQRNTSKSATIIAKKTGTPNILLRVDLSKFRIRDIPYLVFSNNYYYYTL